MAYDIRPLSFSEILDRAFRVYRDNFLLLFGIAAIVIVPTQILFASRSVFGNRGAGILSVVVSLLAGPIMHAALIMGVAEVYLGRPVTITEAYRSARPVALPYIGTSLLYWLGIAVSAGIPIGFGIGVLASMPIGLLAAELAGLAFGTYFAIRWCLHGPVIVLERLFGNSALRRSTELVGDSWLRTLGLVFTAFLLANAPAAALRLIWGFIPLIGPVLTGATQAVSGAYGTVALVIYYFDHRCRTEDFDLRLLAEQVRAESKTAMPESSALA
jgi:hypothetical protein